MKKLLICVFVLLIATGCAKSDNTEKDPKKDDKIVDDSKKVQKSGSDLIEDLSNEIKSVFE